MTAIQSMTLREILSADSDARLMDALQDRGLVSDCCVLPGDVAESDAAAAIVLLRAEALREQGQTELF